jgi:hypothetical protein
LLMSQVAHQQRRVPACFSPPFGEVRIEEKRLKSDYWGRQFISNGDRTA